MSRTHIFSVSVPVTDESSGREYLAIVRKKEAPAQELKQNCLSDKSAILGHCPLKERHL
jgi:hypothetical protein